MAAVLEASTASTGSVLAATKLHIPRERAGVVSRPALVDILVGGHGRKLVLLSAPPGYGKTTLLAEWHAASSETRPFAWLSLDAADNDPVRFWALVIDALRTVVPDSGQDAARALEARGADIPDVALPLLVNELAEFPGPLVLVLDDYHLIHEREVHRSLEFLLEHLPEALQLAIATRSDPPLPLGRLRARGQLTELRAGDLRFSGEEARQLLVRAAGGEVDSQSIDRLNDRTEGWAAGLYMAALSLRQRDDPGEFIESFAGHDRHVVDYLASEVLAGQPEELRQFLLRTSLLGRLSGPLCDAVTQSEGSRRTLEHIERRNLFLVPLDAKREWYRYHHLFADLMRRELELSVAAREIAQLHRRARDWYAHEGAIPDAIHHAFLADDMDQAVELIANSWNDFFNSGELDTVASWLDALPAEAVGGDARLCVARAWLALDRGELEEAADWIEAGQSAAARSPGSEADLAVLRAVHRFKIGDLGEAEKAARDVLRLERDATFARTVGHLILGVSMYWRAASAEATSALEEAAKTAEAMENALGRSYALGYLALTESDDHERKATLAAMATDLGDDPSFAEHFVPMIGHVARAQAEKQAGRLETAERSARRALELSGRGAGRLETALVRVELAEIRHLRGDPDKARGLLREARAIEERCSDSGILPTRVSIVERRLRLARTADQGFDELTDREVAVLRLLTTGLSRGEIARSLYVSDNTVKSHLKGIYRKLDASSRGEAVTRAREQGLL